MSAGRLSFLPARLMRFPAAGWDRAALARAHRFDAAVMVVDVRGFTRLSESVAHAGPAGTERLSDMVNAVFAPIVERVHVHGGEVGLFVGDSVVALFPDGEEALACAAELPSPPDLALGTGLAAGLVAGTVVGDPAGRLEHVLIGTPLRRAAHAAGRAEPGRPVAEPLPIRGPPWPDADVAGARAIVAPFLHPSVAARLDAGRRPLLAEHRQVTALFCRFADLDAADPAAPERLQRVAAAALAELARFDGALLQLELVDKGSTLKAAFGAPVAHEDDERRATACAQALHGRPELRDAAIGLGTGSVLSGLIGAGARREYTVLGDPVNVAARLMLAARPGQILASAATRDGAGADWAWEPRGSLALRGRSAPVAAYAPRAPRSGRPRPHRGALVGRERELDTALALLERARDGAGGALIVSGEPGIGKSRLLAALAGRARARGMTVLLGAGRPYGGDLAYGAWRDVAAELAGGDARLAPLLGRPADDGLDPEHRAEAVRERVVALLRRRAAAAPVLLAFEDAHWLDVPSRAVIERLAPELPGAAVLLVLTARPGGALPRLGGAATLALDGLPPADLHRVVRARAPRLPADVADAIVARCGGNPLFAEELVGVARLRHGAPLPDSLRSAVTARLDALPEAERAVVRLASVIGPRFAPEWLRGSDPALGDAAELARALAALSRADLVHPDGPRHAFKHAVTREVAYETLALAAREHLHLAVARYLERAEDLSAPDVLDALAHHYGRTPDTAKQRVYLRRAGDAARAAFANEAAAGHYRRLRELEHGPAALEATLDLGAVLQLAGAWAEAEALYREALARAASPRDTARARAALGGLLAFTGAHADAVASLEAARAGFAALGERAELATVLERLAQAYFQHGDDARATERATELLGIGDRAQESTALNTLGLVSWHRGELAPAREQLEAALDLARAAGHRVGVVHLLGDLAGLLVALGRVGEAIERLAESHAQAREIGYRRLEGIAVGNAAELFRGAGDDAAALACAGRSLEIGAALGDVLQVIHNATVIAAVRRRQGDPSGADALLERVAAVARARGNLRYLAQARLFQARARHDRGQDAAAAEAAADALRIAREVGQADLVAEAERFPAEPPPGPGADVSAEAFRDSYERMPDPAELVSRAHAALDALNPSNDVVAQPAPA
jgi:class 3 adenylate cyclase/tetratricopeptide (TPR) repeat protein